MKVFISYSHADEQLMLAMKKHLSGLERTGQITAWYDRKIVAGTPIDEKILGELAESNIVLLMISADFMSSDYCMNVEVEQALEQHKVGRSRVIPVIVRPEATWTQFPFGKLMGLPVDGKAITSWTNQDEAWVSVVRGVREAISELRAVPTGKGERNGVVTSYIDELESIDTPFVHPRARKIILSDVFVYPDLEILDSGGSGRLSRSADRALAENGITLLVGDRQSGKTSLLRQFVLKTLREDRRAIYLDMKGQNLANVVSLVQKTAEAKLGSVGAGAGQNTELDLIALDNVDLARNIENGDDELSLLATKAKRVFVASSLDSMVSSDFSKHGLREATAYSINRLSVSKRRKLIEKWLMLGETRSIDSIQVEVDRREDELNSILRRNVVPALPGHVLLVLQGLESAATNKTELTSYGHCYNLMIVAALSKAGVRPAQLDTYVNVLTELSYALHVLGARKLPEREVRAFLESYQQSYLAPPTDEIVAVLLESGLMRKSNGDLIVYRYVSGYFAGKYIADALHSSDTAQKRLTYLADNAHNDDCALVLLFVCHHTKNAAVLETILLNLMVSLDDHEPSKFNREDFEPLRHTIDRIPEAIVSSEAAADTRERRAQLDERSNSAAAEIDDLSSELDPTDDYARLLRAIKAIEISGQLVRNRHGSLPIANLSELIAEAIRCAQRIAGFIIGICSQLESELPGIVADMRKENPKHTTAQVERDVRDFLMFVSHFSLHGVLRMLSQQLTNDALRPLVLASLSGRDDHFAILLRAHVALRTEDPDVIKDLQKQLPEFDGNPFAAGLLRRAVADRLQLFNIPFQDKQRIAEIFGIGVSTQVMKNVPQFGRK